jgi:hypothetical protein
MACPVCGENNNCHMESGCSPATCWCMSEEIPRWLTELLETYGLESCVCLRCSQLSKPEVLQKITKHGH